MTSVARPLNAVEAQLLGTLPPGALAAQFAAMGLPSRRDEAWRSSDLRSFLSQAGRDRRGPAPDVDAILARTTAALNASGVSARLVRPQAQADAGDERAVVPHVISSMPMASLATAAPCIQLSADPDMPMHIVHGTHGAGPVYLRIDVPAGGRLTLIDTILPTADGLLNVLIDVHVGEGAVCSRLILGASAPLSAHVLTTRISLAEKSRWAELVVAEGAGFSRIESHVTLAADAAASLCGAYRLSDSQHADLTSVIHHNGPRGQLQQLVRGVAADQARAVFQGRIEVAREAQKTEARMAHHALVLSDRASVEAKPELRIFADDVACAHGNSVGALDPDALFYLRQRGLSGAMARAMLEHAFLMEVFEVAGDTPLARAGAQWLFGTEVRRP